MMEDIKETEKERAKKKYSLNEEVRKNEMAMEDAKKKRREEERQNEANLEVADKQEVKPKNLRIDDPQLEESGHILADLILASVG
jgi:hypothetical protein